mgnify:CR=1 FL=1
MGSRSGNQINFRGLPSVRQLKDGFPTYTPQDTFNTERMAELDARYTIETDGGDLIYVQNRAVRTAAPEVMARLVRGEAVPPESVYFRCSPSFETASASLGWISERLFVGTGARHPDKVVMRFFEVL